MWLLRQRPDCSARKCHCSGQESVCSAENPIRSGRGFVAPARGFRLAAGGSLLRPATATSEARFVPLGVEVVCSASIRPLRPQAGAFAPRIVRCASRTPASASARLLGRRAARVGVENACGGIHPPASGTGMSFSALDLCAPRRSVGPGARFVISGAHPLSSEPEPSSPASDLLTWRLVRQRCGPVAGSEGSSQERVEANPLGRLSSVDAGPSLVQAAHRPPPPRPERRPGGHRARPGPAGVRGRPARGDRDRGAAHRRSRARPRRRHVDEPRGLQRRAGGQGRTLPHACRHARRARSGRRPRRHARHLRRASIPSWPSFSASRSPSRAAWGARTATRARVSASPRSASTSSPSAIRPRRGRPSAPRR